MKKYLPAILLACFMLHSNLNASAPPNSLDEFLRSQDLFKRRAAYLNILNNREKYIRRVEQGLKTFARTKEKNIDVLKRHIYLAAIIRSDRFLEPLVSISKNYNDLGGWCTYCCPIVFTLSLYGAFQNWSPPETMTGPETYMLVDLRIGIERLKNMKNQTLIPKRLKIEFADPGKQKWYERIETLPLEELICLTGPENADPSERYFASHALPGRVIDSKNLAELYWLAIEELEDDASGIYLCSIYEAIERAEIARAQEEKNRKSDGLSASNLVVLFQRSTRHKLDSRNCPPLKNT
jgi:hypothetical protein